EDGDAEEAGRAEKAAPDDAPAAEDARDVDGEAGAITRALAVVPFDFAAEMTEDERARGYDQEAEEAEPVRQAAPENRAREETQEREDDDLLSVGGAEASREADDLEEGRELDGDVEGGSAGSEAGALNDEEGERPDRRHVTEGGLRLPALRNGED